MFATRAETVGEPQPDAERDLYPHLQHIAHPGACGNTPVMAQNRWPKQELSDLGGSQVGIEVMAEHAVVVAGGGPTGLMLAGELALAGVDVAIAERRPNQDLIGSRAGGLHSRTIEVLDQRGIADRFLTSGQIAQVAGFSQIRLDISDFPTRHPYGLALWQNHIERILAGWVAELAVPVYREHEVTHVAQDRTGVDVHLSGGQKLRAEYLVGCDGGRSVVRKSAGIDFPGWDPTMSYLLAEVEMAVEPDWGIRHDAVGVHALSESTDAGSVRLMVTEQHLVPGAEPTLDDLREALVAVYGTDYGIRSPTWISRATDMTRQAASYRDGRVLLAGDAAHVHHPIGGQGLNTGVQDAVNLGWKLALVANGSAPDSLLDSYHAERYPVAARVLRLTMAQMALLRQPTDDRIKALRDIMSEVLRMDEPRRRFAATMSGLDIHYDLGSGHPLLGRRMPDLDIVTGKGPCRVFTLLHDAHAVLINFGEPGALDVSAWADRVRLVDAKYVGEWELPALGAVTAPDAILVRPDGYVAWVGDASDAGLTDALNRWSGPPSVLRCRPSGTRAP
jgi:2-polyprenyl-6-methoxyphenol hydroxylase-like FAD-dependent oxidoreductase